MSTALVTLPRGLYEHQVMGTTNVRKTPHPLLPSLPLLPFELSPLHQSRQNVSILTLTTPLASSHDKHIKMHHKLHEHSDSVYKNDKTLQWSASNRGFVSESLCIYPFSPPNIHSHEMNILNSMLGSIQESLKSTEATLTSSHPKTSFNPSKSTLQLSSLTTCEPDVRHGRSYSTTRFPRVPYHSLKTSVLYSLRQLCSTTRI